MNVDEILATLNRHEVAYLLIGGMNFLLRHSPVLTYDLDVWIEDSPENLSRCEAALAELQAEWGADELHWSPISRLPSGWLERQSVFCLTSPAGPIDVFRAVTGLDSWAACKTRATRTATAGGNSYWSLSDADMLQCQMALPPGQRNEPRIEFLRNLLERPTDE
jgi:hypothetical protein